MAKYQNMPALPGPVHLSGVCLGHVHLSIAPVHFCLDLYTSILDPHTSVWICTLCLGPVHLCQNMLSEAFWTQNIYRFVAVQQIPQTKSVKQRFAQLRTKYILWITRTMFAKQMFAQLRTTFRYVMYLTSGRNLRHEKIHKSGPTLNVSFTASQGDNARRYCS